MGKLSECRDEQCRTMGGCQAAPFPCSGGEGYKDYRLRERQAPPSNVNGMMASYDKDYPNDLGFSVSFRSFIVGCMVGVGAMGLVALFVIGGVCTRTM